MFLVTTNVRAADNQPPTATPLSVTTFKNTQIAITLQGLDPEGQALTYIIAARPIHGTVTFKGNTATYTPQKSYVGSDSFDFKVRDIGKLTSTSAKVTVTMKLFSASTPLNDTGSTTCSDGKSFNSLPCPVAGLPGQDAQMGRDANQATNNDVDGHRGFSFTKISNTGTKLTASAKKWSCVKDNVTGLMWEVKTDDGGLHDKDWSYTWYEPDNTKNGGDVGIQNGGVCSGTSSCDTATYVQAVNAAGWCGAKDWRMPTVDELAGITALDRSDPAIDTAYFPNTNEYANFWSSSPLGSVARYVNFTYGYDLTNTKSNAFQVRLVRSMQ
jgi:hypothetical protein